MEADELAHLAFGLRMSQELTRRMILVRKRKHLSIEERVIPVELFISDLDVTDNWRFLLKMYLDSPSAKVPHRIKVQAMNYLFFEGECDTPYPYTVYPSK